jgi:hypothetical protein
MERRIIYRTVDTLTKARSEMAARNGTNVCHPRRSTQANTTVELDRVVPRSTAAARREQTIYSTTIGRLRVGFYRTSDWRTSVHNSS